MDRVQKWKPGDVARIKGEGADAVGIHTATGLWVWVDAHGSNPIHGGVCLRASDVDVRPVIVIDPADREQIERLAWLLITQGAVGNNVAHSGLRAALREFANPTPPKPEEPTGLGAVVEDAEGRKYVRTADTDCSKPWSYANNYTDFDWPNIDVVRVLSKGVPA
jgi:hypothetical protein